MVNKFKDLINNITLKRLIVSSIGGLIVGIGVMILQISGLGADAPTVFREGLAKTLTINEGTINIILGIVMVSITFVVDHKQLGIGTILNIFTMSLGMNLTKNFIGGITLNPYIIFIIGLIVVAIGVGMTVVAKLGASYYDAFCVMGGKAIHKSYAVFRYPVDLIMLAIGYLFKGTIGIGTIICTLFIGQIIDVAIKYAEIIFKDL